MSEKPNEIPSIWTKLFSWCFPNPREVDVDTANMDRIEEEQKIPQEISIFPQEYIRAEEKEYIKFTKEGIINFFRNISSKSYMRKFESGGLKISALEESELSDKFPVIRCEVIKPKSEFTGIIPSLVELGNAMTEPEKKLKWDSNLKEYEIVDKLKSDIIIFKKVYNKELSMIPEIEYYEKSISFVDNGVYYFFATSIPDNLHPCQEEPVRCTNYFDMFAIQEDNDTFFIDSINQKEIKTNIPKDLIIMSFPMKMKDFYDKLTNYFKG